MPKALIWSAGLLAALLVIVSSVQAAPVNVVSGSLSWGVKQSFNNYVNGPIARGNISLSDGATQNSDASFRFPAGAGGTYDAAAQSITASFNGRVRYTGHEGELDLSLANLKVQVTGSTGVLRADVTNKTEGQLQSHPNTEFVTLNLAGISPVQTGDTVRWSNIPTALTAGGATVFGGFYQAGQVMDPLTITLELPPPPTPTSAGATPGAGSSGSSGGGSRSSAPLGTPGTGTGAGSTTPEALSGSGIVGAPDGISWAPPTPSWPFTAAVTAVLTPTPTPATGLTWKVSEHAWTSASLAADHAVEAPAVKDPANGFVFPVGQATYDPATGAGAVDFLGSVTLGNNGPDGYHIRLANPSIVVDEARAGVLLATVSHCVGAACAEPWTGPFRVTVATFRAEPGTVNANGTYVSLNVTPSYGGQFAQPFLTSLAPSLRAHFMDTAESDGPLSASNPQKPPAPVSASFTYPYSSSPAAQVNATEGGSNL
jgi:hypothetical protein